MKQDGEPKCVIPRDLFPTSEQLCSKELCGLFLRYNCVGGYKPAGYSCHALATTGDFISDSCVCSNGADPCTYFEARNTEQVWTQGLPEAASVVLARHGLMLNGSAPQTALYTLTDDYDSRCRASPDHFVLCKSVTDATNAPAARREPDCSRAYFAEKGHEAGDDAQCQFACLSATKAQCFSADNPWVCVAEALPACVIPNTEHITCVIESPTALYDSDAQTCGCRDSKPCDAASVTATKSVWRTAFNRHRDSPGAVVLANQQSVWTADPDRFHYENGMHRNGGCGKNPWIRGVFCESKAGVLGPYKSDVVPQCSTATSRIPEHTDAECRILCHSAFEECKNEHEKMRQSSSSADNLELGLCFQRKMSRGQALSGCHVELRAIRQGEGSKGEMQAGWTVATSAWQTVTFPTKFEKAPVVVAGLAEAESPFLSPIIRDVTEEGFLIKLFRKECPDSGRSKEVAGVSWMALPEGKHMPRNSDNGIWALTVELSSAQPVFVPVDNGPAKGNSEIVVLLQVQRINSPVSPIEAVSVVLTSIHPGGAEIALAEEIPWSFSSAVVGLIFLGKQSPDLSYGIPPSLSRRRLQTFTVDNARWSQFSSQRDSIAENVGKRSHIFATPLLHIAPRGVKPEDAVVLQQRPDVVGTSWKLLPWKRVCSSGASYVAAETSDVDIYVGLSVEAVEDAPEFVSDDPEKPCEGVVAHQFIHFNSAQCETECHKKYGDKDGTWTQCVTYCVDVELKSRDECDQLCGAARSKEETDCLKQCRDAHNLKCNADCKDALTYTCALASDKWLCLRAMVSMEFLAECRIKRRLRHRESRQDAQEDEDESTESRCTIVNMSDYVADNFAGWDATARTCKCPNGLHACSSASVERQVLQEKALFDTVKKFCEGRQSPTFNPPVARGFTTPENICDLANLRREDRPVSLIWKEIPPPAYSDIDLKLDDVAVPSGDNLCRSTWTHVFCPVQVSTMTTTAPPPQIEPRPHVSIVSQWSEWGQCSATCRTHHQAPFRSRARTTYVIGKDTLPALWETKTCDDLPVCGEVCWTSGWSEWTECQERFIGGTVELVQARIDHVYDFREVCANDNFIELRECVDDYYTYGSLASHESENGHISGRQPAPGDEGYDNFEGGTSLDFMQQDQPMSMLQNTTSTRWTSDSLSLISLGNKGDSNDDGSAAANPSGSETRNGEVTADVSVLVPPTTGEELNAAPAEGARERNTPASEKPNDSGIAQHDRWKAGRLAGSVSVAAPGGLPRVIRESPFYGSAHGLGASNNKDSVAGSKEISVCPSMLSWSGCDAPCVFHEQRLPRRYRAVRGGFLPSETCSEKSNHVEDCTGLPVCSHPNIDCEQLAAVAFAESEKEFCRESCEDVLRQCSDLLGEGKYVATSVEKCFLRHFEESLTSSSRCRLPAAYRAEHDRPKCFLSHTRQLPGGLFLTKVPTATTPSSQSLTQTEDLNEKGPSFLGGVENGNLQAPPDGVFSTGLTTAHEVVTGVSFIETCVCYDPDDEPCTAEEAYDSLQTTLKPFLTEPLCPPYLDEGGNLVKNGRETSDSAVYFALKGNQRMHCPVAQRKKTSRLGKPKKGKGVPATFTTFDTTQDLRHFCENGLPHWKFSLDGTTMSIHLPYCKAAQEKRGIQAGAANCRNICEEARNLCFESSRSPAAVARCLQQQLRAPAFAEHCDIPASLMPGKGIIVCKKKESDCTLSEWSEWTACSDSCYSKQEARLSLRSRSRSYVRPSSINEAICSKVQDENTVEIEECVGLPYCSDEERNRIAVDKAYDIHAKQEPQLSQWTPTRPSVEESEDDSPPVSVSSCYIADMSQIPASLDRGFDGRYNTCSCPGKDSRPCSSAEVLASLSRWATMGNILCNRDPTLTILAQQLEQFHCALKSFRKLGSPPDCTVQEYALVFCTGEEITSAELSAVWYTCLIFGLVAGLACVLLCLQHSGDVQKLLGLSGSYPRLIREMNQLNAKEAGQAQEERAFNETGVEPGIRSMVFERGIVSSDFRSANGVSEDWIDGVTKSTSANESMNSCGAPGDVGDSAIYKGRSTRVKTVKFADEYLVSSHEVPSSSTESVSPAKTGVESLLMQFHTGRSDIKDCCEKGEADGDSADHAHAGAHATLEGTLESDQLVG